jgi:hypothetical protein
MRGLSGERLSQGQKVDGVAFLDRSLPDPVLLGMMHPT